MWCLNWLHLSEGRVKERAVHKSFLDIAASLPQTHFLPASLCLSSKLHNPCQSCLDCRLKVIHKHREREWERTEKEGRDGGDYNLLYMKLCSTLSYDNYLLLAFTDSIHFFIGTESAQMEPACNYNAPSAKNRALCEHMGEPIIGFLRLPASHCFHLECQHDGFKSRSNLKALIKNRAALWIKCWESEKQKQNAAEESTALLPMTM